MIKIDTMTGAGSQRVQLILDDGSVLTLDFDYWAAVERWGVSLSWPGSPEKPLATPFVVMGLGICQHPNLLRSWRNLIPFGLYCRTKDGVDPINVNDFETDRAQLYILNEDEVAQMEGAMYQEQTT